MHLVKNWVNQNLCSDSSLQFTSVKKDIGQGFLGFTLRTSRVSGAENAATFYVLGISDFDEISTDNCL